MIVFGSLIFEGALFALLVLLSLAVLWISVGKTPLASGVFPEFLDNNLKLFEVEIGLVNDVLILDANLVGIMKGSV